MGKIRVLGDDSHTIVSQSSLVRFNMQNLITDALDMFNLTINEKKIVIAEHASDASFLGYTNKCCSFTRPTEELFKSILYCSSSVTTIQVSLSRLFSFLLLGGCNDF